MTTHAFRGWSGPCSHGHRAPAPSLVVVSAVFHNLGPSFAVLLFVRMDVLGVAWLRLATAAMVFACWRRPWRLLVRLNMGQRLVLVGWVPFSPP